MGELENVRAVPLHDPDSRYSDGGVWVEPELASGHPLDAPGALKVHARLMDWFTQERERQAVNRYQMALDQDFYDGLQFSEEDAAELLARGQAPLVYNEIKPTLDWLIGTERRTRIDYHVFPRSDDDVALADVKTKVFKYVSDINKLPFQRSRAFKDAAIVGVGWLEDGVRGDDSDDPVYARAESWRNVWYDSSSIELDMADARFIFRRKWVDEDVALFMFPDRREVIEKAAVSANLYGSDFDEEFYLGATLAMQSSQTNFARRTYISDSANVHNRRARVELIECWYRDPVRFRVMRGEAFDGVAFDGGNGEHVAALERGAVSLFDKLEMRVRCAVLTRGALLQEMASPYRHNRFPFTPIWCYRRGRDNAPYGVVRNIRDPQEDLNKRASKALFILSSNQVVAEAGAVDDWDALREEVARPDGIIVRNKGKELEIRQDKQLAEEHIQLMERDANVIRNVGGVTDANLGRDSNAVSGRAILAQQSQGSVVTAELFDNLRLAVQLQGENLLSLAEQFYAAPKVIRLVGGKGRLEWVRVNEVQPDGSYLNDITANEADFVVDEQDYRESLRIAMFEQMMNMLQGMPPQLALNLLDLVFEFSDVPGKDELVARIRKISGQRGAEEKPSPEEEAQVQQASQEKAEADALQKRMAEAKVAEVEAKVKELESARMMKMVEAMYAALQAAQVAASVPGVAPVAGEILAGSGFQAPPMGAGEPGPVPAGAPMSGPVPPGHVPDLQPPALAGGMEHGIETVENDGVRGPGVA